MKSLRGFTLTELFLVIALVGFMSSVVFISFSRQRNETALRSAAREVASAVRAAQGSALSGVKKGIPAADSNRLLCSIEIGSNGGSQYRTRVHYENGGDGVCPNPPAEESVSDQESFSLPNGISFASDWSVFFRIPRAEVSSGAATNIVLSRNGSSTSVCILSSGAVLENSGSCP